MTSMRLADARATRREDATQGGTQPTLVCTMPAQWQLNKTFATPNHNYIRNSRYATEGRLPT